MYEKYPISGITQSYRHTREVPTVVMPVLIGLLLLAMVTFFFQSKPEEVPAPQEIASTPKEAKSSLAPPLNGAPESETGAFGRPALLKTPDEEPAASLEPLREREPTPDEPADTERQSASLAPDLTTPEETNGNYTAWMTPLALDTYIRLKNKGYSESFWQRGHWITAVEGRWSDDTHEFRIALETIPDRNHWQWQYRVNQSTEDFAASAREYADEGFVLVHSQSFVEPDGEPRFQAVWQRELPEAAPVVETSSPTSSVSDPSRPLDVNNLRFR